MSMVTVASEAFAVTSQSFPGCDWACSSMP